MVSPCLVCVTQCSLGPLLTPFCESLESHKKENIILLGYMDQHPTWVDAYFLSDKTYLVAFKATGNGGVFFEV